MYKIVFIRHGESQWNKENRFTGWTDVPLTRLGREQALKAGKYLKENGFVFDMAYTSVLKRAIHTLNIVLDEMDLQWIPVVKNWKLNERHYGALQGLNKAETAAKHGEGQVKIWRRSYDICPPALDEQDHRYPGFENKYLDVDKGLLPFTECLSDTVKRVIPYWKEEIVPYIKQGKQIIIAAHGNSIRALVKYLDDVSREAILELNIPTGMPLVYELGEDLKPIRSYYLGDPDKVKAAMEAVANQGKVK